MRSLLLSVLLDLENSTNSNRKWSMSSSRRLSAKREKDYEITTL